MINFDYVKKNMKKHNPNWLKIPDQLYRLLIIQSSERGKTNSLFSLTSQQPEKIYMLKVNMKQSVNCQLKNKKVTKLKHLNDSKPLFEYLNDEDDIIKILKNIIQIKK